MSAGLSLGVAYREHHRDGLREQPPGHEREGLQGHLVQPLGVVDHDKHGSGLGGPGEQGQHGQTDQEAVGRVSGRHPEGHTERVALGPGKRLHLGQERCTQLVQARVGQLHVRFDALGPGDGHLRRPGDRVLQEHRLPDACFAMEHPNA